MILVLSIANDPHATAVRWALRRMRVECLILDIYDIVNGGSISLTQDLNELSWRASATSDIIKINLNAVDTVWLRRLNDSYFDMSRVHPDDRNIVLKELSRLSEAIFSLTSLRAKTSINPLDAQFGSWQKTIQLVAAAKAGLSIPDTAITNDPDTVAQLMDLHESVLFKPFSQRSWSESGKKYVHHASRVGKEILQDRSAIELCPGIYQNYIQKLYELRIVVMGETLIAYKLDSQALPSAATDWRGDITQRMSISLYDDLPSDIIDKILRFMRAMNLNFGSIDMIVTSDNEFVFLEVNEQGQFLWLDERVPDGKLLKKFSEFLCESSDVKYTETVVDMASYYASKQYARDYRLLKSRP